MASTSLLTIDRPPPDIDHTTRSRWQTAGFVLALVGLVAVLVAFVGNVVAGGLVEESAESAVVAKTLSWTFGLTTTGFGTIKVAIAVILIGIVVRLWIRVDSVKESVAELKLPSAGTATAGPGVIETDFGRADVGPEKPAPLGIHRMAQAMWAPMLLMGGMAVLVGFVLSLLTSAQVGSNPDLAVTLSAWTQGTQFLGETFLLGGISLLLGTILGSLREGGGEVQEDLGVPVETLRMPASAKAFVVLMATGLMVGVAQFALYAVAATSSDPVTVSAWFAFLGPMRELSLGVLLSGIVLALITIGTVLGFQFSRIRTIVRTGT